MSQEVRSLAPRSDADFWRMRDLLVRAAPITPIGFNTYAGIPYAEVNRLGIFEPVCTHPDHRRRGLARSLMREGILRLRSMGAVEAIVDTGDMEPANALYDSLGFSEAHCGYAWQVLLYAPRRRATPVQAALSMSF
jgi:GNAT superfamily N-acetyltransferase